MNNTAIDILRIAPINVITSAKRDQNLKCLNGRLKFNNPLFTNTIGFH